MATPLLTRRRFGCLAGLGLVGGAGYGLSVAVRRVRDAARRASDE